MRRSAARPLRVALLVLVALCVQEPSAPANAQQSTPESLARAAVSADSAQAERAIWDLRSLGRRGHEALMTTHARGVATLRSGETSPELERLRHAIDVVSGQRDGHASGLYFHTVLDEALAEARARHVPVLSLRMLGRLDEELSCANSRYFRTILYPNEAVARMLKERFVLHVSMERPVPRITIDMGDGRTMVRTITGNSVHYVLDARGRVIDAIPGLYAPAQFLVALESASRRTGQCASLERSQFARCVASVHREALAAQVTAWSQRRAANPSLPDFAVFTPDTQPRPSSARNAMPTTISKMSVETVMLDRIAREPTPARADPVSFLELTRSERLPLDARTLALLRLKADGADITTLAASLVANATADGLRNELMMRRAIHMMFVNDESVTGFDALNARVYTEIFRTPANDPWLGLRAPDVWDAIESVR